MGQDKMWSVTVSGHGRSGEVAYREEQQELIFYWELMTGDVLASIHVGTVEAWRNKANWCRERRQEILARVAQEVIRIKAPGSVYRLDAEPGFLDIISKPD